MLRSACSGVLLGLVAAAGVLASPIAAQGPHRPDESAAVSRARQQIDSVNALYIKAYADANVDEVVALYDTAASELLANGRVEHGHPALRRYWGGFIKTYGPLTLTLDMADFWLVADKAYETGKYTSVIKKMDGKSDTYNGNYATVWQRQGDGGWKILAVFDTPQ